MKAALLCLASLALWNTAVFATEESTAVDLSQLDHPPERIGYQPVQLTDSLREAKAHDTVTMVAVVSPLGTVEAIKDVQARNPAHAEAAEAAVRAWRFAPATAGGQPVAFRLPVAVAIRPESSGDLPAGQEQGSNTTAPQPTYETIPAYPPDLKDAAVDGYAAVNLLVGADGKPSDAVVEFATRDEFATPAVDAVLDWSFAPAHLGQQAVASRTTVKVGFSAKSASWTDAARIAETQLQYASSFDTPPRAKPSPSIVFPYEALLASQKGDVTINILVSPEGNVVEAVTAADAPPDPIFFGAAQAGLTTWKFEPATKAGRPVYGLASVKIPFDEYRPEFGFDTEAFALLKALRDGSAAILSLKQVDEMPKPTRQVAPRLLPNTSGPDTGEAMIEFIIDAKGRCRFPRVVRSTSPELGWSAATAVGQWQFEPARKAGEPVTVRARMPVRFKADPPPAAP